MVTSPLAIFSLGCCLLVVASLQPSLLLLLLLIHYAVAACASLASSSSLLYSSFSPKSPLIVTSTQLVGRFTAAAAPGLSWWLDGWGATR